MSVSNVKVGYDACYMIHHNVHLFYEVICASTDDTILLSAEQSQEYFMALSTSKFNNFSPKN